MNKMLRLIIGSAVMGSGLAIAMKGGFGADPMALFWEGVHLQSGLSFGSVNLLVSAVMIVAIFFVDRSQMGVGTIINPLIVSAVMDFLQVFLFESELLVFRLLFLVIGLVMLAAGISYYGSAQLGKGAFEGLVFGLANRSGYSIRFIRSSLDFMLTGLGMLLGARLSLGVVLSVLMMGPLIQFFYSKLTQIHEK